ncbi:MAG: hypothetical protein QXN71_02145 [Candidatus Aenigmatarchaeota archaeon]
MAIKDLMFSWFIKNILIPKNEIIDRPGFIILKLSDKKEITNIREVLLPEKIFVDIEREIINKYKENGAHLLYSIGKNFGYRYASVSHYPSIKEKGEKDFLKFTYFVIKYLESIYSSKITYKIDIKRKIFKIYLKNYIVCNKNGLGYLLTDGSITGTCAYGVQDFTLEGTQIKCQGRGNEKCEFICAPPDYFKKKGMHVFIENNLYAPAVEIDKYNNINAIRNTKFASNSLQSLIDSGFIAYKNGIMNVKFERFLLIEASVMYLLESGLSKLKDGLKILWDCSFSFGKRLAEISGKQEPCKFITDLFPALGFGDILAVEKKGKYEVYVNYFPWMEFPEVDFVMFRGLLSGVISGFVGRKVELKKIEKDISAGYLSLFISE